jgi:HEPN domain-containing protein
MNRADLQHLAEVRLREADALLQGGNHPGAYYLGGYTVECALKACIAKQTQQFDFPDKTLVARSHTHNLSELLALAGLKPQLGRESAALRANWGVVKDWSERSRYQVRDAQAAQDLFDAIADASDGVLEWLKQHW